MAKKSFAEIQSDPVIGFTNPDDIQSSLPAEKSGADEATLKKLPKSTKTPKGYKLDPRFVEIRDHRMQLLLPASLSDGLRKRAKKEKVSVNDLCNRVLAAFIFEE